MSTMQLHRHASLPDARKEIESIVMRLIGVLIIGAQGSLQPGSSIFHKFRGMMARATLPNFVLRIATYRAIAQAERYVNQSEPGAAHCILRVAAKRLATLARSNARGA